jgi:hypothetical protein
MLSVTKFCVLRHQRLHISGQKDGNRSARRVTNLATSE